MSKIRLLCILLINIVFIMPSLSEENTADSSNIMVDVYFSSSEKTGYDVYLDTVYIGTDGQKGDELDGAYRLLITGNMNHSVIADDGNFTYGLSDYYFTAGIPYVISIDSSQMKLGPSNKAQHVDKEPTTSQSDKAVKSEYSPPQSDSNVPPLIESLNAEKKSPQEIGATIIWRAQASDPESDQIYYKFLLSGPRTEEKWNVVQDWSTNNLWSWKVEESDIGKSLISVQIRDGHHASTPDMDDLKNSTSYEIKAKQLTSLNVQVVNDVYSEADRKVYYCQEGKYYSIRNRLYLTGPDLDKVAKVKYVLPPSFPNTENLCEDASKNFETWILTWGRFNGIAIVTTKSGQEFDIPYNIAFKDKVEMAKAKGIPMVQNCEG